MTKERRRIKKEKLEENDRRDGEREERNGERERERGKGKKSGRVGERDKGVYIKCILEKIIFFFFTFNRCFYWFANAFVSGVWVCVGEGCMGV